MSDTPNKKVVGTGYATTTPPLTATANIPKTTEIPISDEVIQEILALDERFRHDVVRYANFSPNAEWNDALDSIVNAFHIETAMYFAHHNIDIFYKIPVAAAIIRQQQERIKELEGEAKTVCDFLKSSITEIRTAREEIQARKQP